MVLGKKGRTISPENAIIRLQDYCARAEHCTHEIREKLCRWGIIGADADHILKSLIDGRFVDYRRFASAFVRDKSLYSRWGRRKIAAALMVKRIPRHVIDEALGEIDEEAYRAELFGFMKAKCRSIKEGNSYEGRTRLFRAAAARGYEAELISGIIRSCNDELWGC